MSYDTSNLEGDRSQPEEKPKRGSRHTRCQGPAELARERELALNVLLVVCEDRIERPPGRRVADAGATR